VWTVDDIQDVKVTKDRGERMSSEDEGEPASAASKKKAAKKKTKTKDAKKAAKGKTKSSASTAKFPRHSVEKALRIPRAIIDQNAGHICSEAESAVFVGVGYNGPYRVEVSSSIKYGFLSRPTPGRIAVTERAQRAIRPQKAGDDVEAFREAVLAAPEISEVYTHYRGEYLPDEKFFENALVDKFSIPAEKVAEFKEIFLASLQSAQLVEKKDDKYRILDTKAAAEEGATTIKKLSTAAKVSASDTCFVLMPFGSPVGDYYRQIYEPAIKKAGMRPVRADDDIFGAGKIIDQIWDGINAAKVLVAEMTNRNPNVFYELGLAHALEKPVVLISSNEDDVPFDLKHIRVIYYNVSDPFWGEKLIEKVAENILSALSNPEEAVFKRALNR
jgi:hypothetical protein